MRIIVCVKQVPSSNEVRLDPDTHTIIRDGRASVINPFDTYALEEAVRLKESLGGQVTVISMGIPATERLLRDAISRGADEALLLSDRAFAGADTLATSYVLALGIRELGDFDLILCGKMAVDGDTAQIGPELAETLGIPHITEVKRIGVSGDRELTCLKTTDNSELELRLKLPALITVAKDINMPRLPSIPGIKRSLELACPILSAEDLQADTNRCGLKGSPTQVVKTFTPERNQQAIEVRGNTSQQAAAIAEVLREVLS